MIIQRLQKLREIKKDLIRKRTEHSKKGIICEECLRKLIFSNRVKDTESEKKISFYNNMKGNLHY